MNEEFKKKVFQLKINLDDTDPLVWRRVYVSSTMSLRETTSLDTGAF